MNRLQSLILGLAVWLLPVMAMAAGSAIVVSGDDLITTRMRGYESALRIITVAFTADSVTGAIPTLDLDGDTTGLKHGSPIGLYGYKIQIDCNHAGTEPTEDSELYIYENSIDMLGGGGVDQVDNTAEREILFKIGSTQATQPLTDTWTITITQQAAETASATGTIRIFLVP